LYQNIATNGLKKSQNQMLNQRFPRAQFVTPQHFLKLYVIENEYIFHEDLNAIIQRYVYSSIVRKTPIQILYTII